ncbi:hypothetical protein BHE74_00050694 [Ensete ventricosum]|nr:hypothetical protein GW17_00043550 [Ensete ventricosum]RWW43622.1 hypothetical protein BHE74_00050694 [Ensete ventricosum]RZS22886.1 hypothetical protein BHM03_00055755 [Ensete ventricosum]
MNSPSNTVVMTEKGRKQEAVVIMSGGLEGRSEGMHAAPASGNLRPLETKDWIGIGAADLKQERGGWDVRRFRRREEELSRSNGALKAAARKPLRGGRKSMSVCRS